MKSKRVSEKVPTKVEKLAAGQIPVPNAAAEAMVWNRQLPKGHKFRRPPSLMERLVGRVVSPAGEMPPEVRLKAPKRVQEAMQVVEDYVASLDGPEAGKEVPERE